MSNEFEKRDLKIPLKQNYHAHNEYLQTLLNYGAIGLIIVLCALFWPFKKALDRKNFLAVFWIALVALTAVTESIFSRQWGLFSFVFFSSIFLLELGNVKTLKDE